MTFKRKKQLDIQDNKEVQIKYIKEIDINNFRTFQDVKVLLGSQITILSGRNGTMKSTLMGLISHPFRSSHKSVYGNNLQTKFSDVFRMSSEKDKPETDQSGERKGYEYFINMELIDGQMLGEPVKFYYQEGKAERFRIVPSGSQKGDGFFWLPSIFVSLKRLIPLIETEDIAKSEVEYSDDERRFISNFFERVLLRSEFNNFENYEANFGTITKNPKGPNLTAKYDVNTISSGEDNLGTLADAMVSLMRVRNHNKEEGLKNNLTGLLVIDEIEASIHPVAQLNLFHFLVRWSRDYKVQVIISTHSLYLIQQILIENEKKLNKGIIEMNFITSGYEKGDNLTIINNPPYKIAYSELTLKKPETGEDSEIFKIPILCEDDMAKILIKRILKSLDNNFDISHAVNDNNTGTSKNLLINLGRNYPKLLKESDSLIIFDADVEDEETQFNNFDNYLILPSLHNFSIEKEIIAWILSLDNGDPFFTKVNQTKEHFRQTFSEFHIPTSNIPQEHEDMNIQSYKNWVNRNDGEFKTYITQYVNRNLNNNSFKNFKESLIELGNKIRIKNSLPLIES